MDSLQPQRYDRGKEEDEHGGEEKEQQGRGQEIEHRAEKAEIVTVSLIISRVISQTDRQAAVHFLHLDLDKDHRKI